MIELIIKFSIFCFLFFRLKNRADITVTQSLSAYTGASMKWVAFGYPIGSQSESFGCRLVRSLVEVEEVGHHENQGPLCAL